MPATKFNNVGIQASDLKESLAFYTDVLGMDRIPSPVFRFPTAWLRVGDQELHLFHSDTPAPRLHFALTVDDFEAVYVKSKALGIQDRDSWSHQPYELPDGSVQIYLRDPAGNLVEVDCPDVSTLDRSVVTDIRKLADDVPQTRAPKPATLFLDR
jgi:catechol 2,3-dioxygenase-like lactoylglutathione lyase family enzyme